MAVNASTLLGWGMTCLSAISPATWAAGLGLRTRSTCAIVDSMRLPYGTPDGQATSQARHCMQRSQWRITESVMPILPSFTAFISAILPRGDSVSRPVST